jgi:ribosomal-protein-alanine N-acetyltransferase
VVLLEGPRVRLAPFEVDEIKAIALGLRRKDWAGDYPSDGDRIIAEQLSHGFQEVAPWCHYTIKLHSGLVIGGAGFHGPPINETVEIGYGLAPSQRRRGYAREAVKLLVGVAATSDHVSIVRAVVSTENVASQRVVEDLGFACVSREDGRLTYLLQL